MSAATATADLDARVDALLDMPYDDFKSAVYAYIKDRDRTVDDEDVFQAPEIVERTYKALDELLRFVDESRRAATGNEHRFLTAMHHKIASEKKVVKPLAGAERERLIRSQRGEGGPRARARHRLAQLRPVEYLALVREEQARDRAR